MAIVTIQNPKHALERSEGSKIQNRIIQNPLFWLIAALAAGLLYLAVSAWGFGVYGFPLDDAWIHQTYARNLARSGQLAFTPGVPSSGSTAPLWSLLLGLGYLLRLPFQTWTYGLGLIFLALTGQTVARLDKRLFPEQRRVGLLAGLFCIFEWHLVWTAVSGMETILFIWLSTLLVERYLAYQSPGVSEILGGLGGARGNSPRIPPGLPEFLKFWTHPQSPADITEAKHSKPAWGSTIFGHRNPKLVLERSEGSKIQNPKSFSLGILGGLLILTRPEGLGLIGLIGLDMAYRWWRQKPKKQEFFTDLLPHWLLIAAGVSLLLIPYVSFHLWTTGLPFPNTFYAKQSEYHIILDSFPLWWRLFGNFGPSIETVQGVFRVIFIGPQILLLPGLFFAAWLSFAERRTVLIPIWLWWISFLLLYGLRLPVTYQHGRYQIPAIAWVILLGVWGTSRLLNKLSRQQLILRAAGRALALSLLILVLAFTVVGARAYGRDVHFIESEMVVTAKWLNENTAPEALIAAHDIGAIGYFTQRPLIDLAGLITPEVIPFIRDEAALFDFIIARQAERLVTFPSWYPNLTQNPTMVLIYSTDALWPPQASDDNMAVYQIDVASKP